MMHVYAACILPNTGLWVSAAACAPALKGAPVRPVDECMSGRALNFWPLPSSASSRPEPTAVSVVCALGGIGGRGRPAILYDGWRAPLSCASCG